MREILFKGKRTDNNSWVYGNCILQENYTLIRYWNNEIFEFEEYLVSPESIGQYTGFKDKNNVHIFEGDIIRRWWGRKDFQNTVYVIRFKNGAFCAEYSNTNYYFPIDTMLKNKIEVIGNIYDNPELLKVVK